MHSSEQKFLTYEPGSGNVFCHHIPIRRHGADEMTLTTDIDLYTLL